MFRGRRATHAPVQDLVRRSPHLDAELIGQGLHRLEAPARAA